MTEIVRHEPAEALTNSPLAARAVVVDADWSRDAATTKYSTMVVTVLVDDSVGAKQPSATHRIRISPRPVKGDVVVES